MKTNQTPRPNRCRTRLFAALILPAILAIGLRAQPADTQSKVHGLINLEFSDHYITPRGLNVENQGIIIQPLLLLFWDLHSSNQGALQDVSLTTGVWNSWHSNESGANPGNWNETDPIVGLTFKFQGGWQFDAFYTGFHSQVESYPTSTNLDLKLTYHDSGSLGIPFNPYIEFFDEIKNKATVVFDPATSKTSSYFQFGIDPTLPLPGTKIKLELPTFMSYVGSNFYQKFDGSPGGSGIGVISTYLKASVPLTFISPAYGHWTGYAGVQYYYLKNEGVIDGNQVLGAVAERKTSLVQFHAGVSIFF